MQFALVRVCIREGMAQSTSKAIIIIVDIADHAITISCEIF